MEKALVNQGPEVSIIIPIHNQWEYVQQCLESIEANTQDINYEIIAVDDASDKITKTFLRQQKLAGKIRIVLNRAQYGFPVSCNRGIRASRAEFVCLLNSDTLPTDGWLTHMLQVIKEDRLIGIVGPATNCRNNKQMHHCLLKANPSNIDRFSQQIQQEFAGQAVESSFLIAFCWLMRRSMCDRIGLFDVRFRLGGGEDFEYQKRAKLHNYKVVWAKAAFVYHHGHKTFQHEPIDLFDQAVQKQINALVTQLYKEEQEKIARTKSIVAPKVSIVVPVRSRLMYFEQFYDSLINSTDVSFELIIVDDDSNKATKAFIDEIRHNAVVPTIVLTNTKHLGYAKTCNKGIREARGEYICLASTDILVTRGWLDQLVAAAEQNPRGGIFGPSTNIDNKNQIPPEYADKKVKPDDIESIAEDLHKTYGDELEQAFVYAFCYLLRSSMITQIGVYDEQFGIGMGEDIEYRYRAHYHGWCSYWVKSAYVYHYGHKSIQLEFSHKGAYRQFKERQKALARDVVHNRYYLGKGLADRDGSLDVSIVMPIRNEFNFVQGCIASVVRHTSNFELILVDDDSTPEVYESLQQIADTYDCVVLLRNSKQCGFGLSCNKGIKIAQAPYICLLNTDTLVTAGWMTKMLEVARQDSKYGLIGPTTNFGNKYQEVRAARSIKSPARLDRHYEKVIEPLLRGQTALRYLTAFCWVMSKEMIDDIGLFDERFYMGMYEDLEYLERAWLNGYESVWVKDAFVYHYGHRSFDAEGMNDRKIKKRNLALLNKIRQQRDVNNQVIHKWMRKYAG